MIKYLKIRNLALLQEAELFIEPGFTAVTGQTGAGKSILLGALNMLAGCKTDEGCIGGNQDRCEVEALIDIEHHVHIQALLDEHDIPTDAENKMVIRRIIYADKLSKAWVNGVLMPIHFLSQLAAYWIDFHGPQAPQRLYHEDEQRALLDKYAKNKAHIEAYQTMYKKWQATMEEIHTLQHTQQLDEDEKIFYHNQLEKLRTAVPSAQAIEALEQTYERQNKKEALMADLHQLEKTLGPSHISNQINQLCKISHDIKGQDAGLIALSDRLQSVLIEVEDIAYEYGQYLHGLAYETCDTQQLEKQMNAWLEMKRLYGPTLEQVLAKKIALEKKLAAQEDIVGQIFNLENQAKIQNQALQDAATILTHTRHEYAKKITHTVAALLPSLGLTHARLDIRIEPLAQPQGYGMDKITFLFSANPDQALQPLHKIASSGEMARVMLAFEAALAASNDPKLLVFDEVDANIGGEIATQVGKKLKDLGCYSPVLAVTHLPQVAAAADYHWVVTKMIKDQRTCVRVESISHHNQERLGELARMLGDRQATSALQHAATLIGQFQP